MRPRDHTDAIECKWNHKDFDPASLKVFRADYPRGKNYLVTPSEGPAYVRRFGSLEVTVCSPEGIGADSTS